jgi:hypothetical protein
MFWKSLLASGIIILILFIITLFSTLFGDIQLPEFVYAAFYFIIFLFPIFTILLYFFNLIVEYFLLNGKSLTMVKSYWFCAFIALVVCTLPFFLYDISDLGKDYSGKTFFKVLEGYTYYSLMAFVAFGINKHIVWKK